MPVERCAAPAHETRGVFGGAALGASVSGDSEFVRDDGRVGQRAAEACPVLSCCGDAGIDPLDDELELSELQEAWAEFAEAAKDSGAKSVHACTRNGKPWQKDPSAVRSMAALLRRVRDEDTTPGTEPDR